MMPKGVEHTLTLVRTGSDTRWVKIPMMPKGVEHLLRKRWQSSSRCVKIPMMPKGVEHQGFAGHYELVKR